MGRLPAAHLYTVNLRCEHQANFGIPGPYPGDIVWCHRCDDYSTVLTVDGEWSVKCHDCRYAKSFGRSQLTADTKGAAHALKKQHTVIIWQEGTEECRKIEPRKQVALPFDSPPY